MHLYRPHSICAVLVLTASACGSSPSPVGPTPTATALPSASASAAVATEPDDEELAARPSSRAAYASLEVSDLARVTAESPFATTVLLDTLGVDAHAIAPDHDWAGRLGVSPGTRIELEAAELDARAANAVNRWATYDPSLPADVVGASLVDEPAAKKLGFLMSRASVRGRDAKLIDLAEQSERSVETRIPVEGGTLYLRPNGEAVVARRIGDLQEVARVVGPSPLAPADARRVIAALDAWKAPESTAGPARIELEPRAFALAAFWYATARGLARAGADPVRAARALEDGRVALTVDAPDGTPRYGRTTLTFDHATQLSAELTRATPDLDAAASRADGADVAIAGMSARVSVNGALLFAWPLLPKGRGNPYRAADVDRVVGKPSWRAALLGADVPFYVARDTVERMSALVPHTLAVMNRFERIGCGTLDASGGLVCFGLLLDGVPEAKSACALERDDVACAPAVRLPIERIVARAGLVVARKKVGARWVLVAARNRADLTGLRVTIKAGPRAPFVAEVPTRSLGGFAGFYREPFHVEGGLQGRTLRFVATTPNAPGAPTVRPPAGQPADKQPLKIELHGPARALPQQKLPPKRP